MLVSAHVGGVHTGKRQDLDGLRVFLGNKLGQDFGPAPFFLPAHQAVMAGGEGAVAFGQVPPGSARAVNPENTVKDCSMIAVGPSSLAGALGREEGLNANPFFIGYIKTSHQLCASKSS
jgi:hypothetical protein